MQESAQMLQASPIRVGNRVLVAQYSNKPEISARPVRVRARLTSVN